jgi:glycosyltransferase involved in cell wall biosynthesis
MLVSVVVPACNAERYMDRCMESLAGQTYRNIEIIVVNDGSTDTTRKICEKWALHDSRICVINQENAGVSVARNKGLEIAKGDYICFVDADDYVDKSYVELLLEAVVFDQSEMAVCRIGKCYGDAVIDDEILPEPYAKDKDDLFHSYYRHFFRIQGAEYMGGYAVRMLISTKLIRDNKINFRNCRISEDLLFTMEAVGACNKISSVDKVLYFYTINQDSVTHVTYIKNALEDRIVFIRELKNVLDKNCVNETDKELVLSYAVLNNRAALLCNALRAEAYKNGRREIRQINTSELGTYPVKRDIVIERFLTLKPKKKITEVFLFFKQYRMLRIIIRWSDRHLYERKQKSGKKLERT